MEFINQFENEVMQIDEILECYHVSGDYDYILKIVVKVWSVGFGKLQFT